MCMSDFTSVSFSVFLSTVYCATDERLLNEDMKFFCVPIEVDLNECSMVSLTPDYSIINSL